jgi:hypothetical protein
MEKEKQLSDRLTQLLRECLARSADTAWGR